MKNLGLEKTFILDRTYYVHPYGNRYLSFRLHDAMNYTYQTMATEYAFVLKKELLERRLQLLD